MVDETILIIDDDLDLHNLLDFYLGQLLGYKILHAFDGKIGLKRIQNHHPDLVMLDMNMPAMNGLETLKICIYLFNYKFILFVTIQLSVNK